MQQPYNDPDKPKPIYKLTADKKSDKKSEIKPKIDPEIENKFTELGGLLTNKKKDDLKKQIISDRTIVNMRNFAGETLLHALFKNQNLRKKEKSDIAKILIENNASINVPDTNKTYPLHLACKFQLLSCVELLFENGALASMVDKNNRNILHYHISSYDIACPDNRNEKLKSLIKPNFDRKDRDINAESQKILDALYSVFGTDKAVLMHMSNVYNTMLQIFYMYPSEIYERQEKCRKEVSNMIKNNDVNIFERINLSVQKYTKEVYDFIIEKQKSEITMPVYNNATFMKDIDEITSKIMSERIFNKKETGLGDFEKQKDKLKTGINKIKGYSNEINASFNKCLNTINDIDKDKLISIYDEHISKINEYKIDPKISIANKLTILIGENIEETEKIKENIEKDYKEKTDYLNELRSKFNKTYIKFIPSSKNYGGDTPKINLIDYLLTQKTEAIDIDLKSTNSVYEERSMCLYMDNIIEIIGLTIDALNSEIEELYKYMSGSQPNIYITYIYTLSNCIIYIHNIAIYTCILNLIKEKINFFYQDLRTLYQKDIEPMRTSYIQNDKEIATADNTISYAQFKLELLQVHEEGGIKPLGVKDIKDIKPLKTEMQQVLKTTRIPEPIYYADTFKTILDQLDTNIKTITTSQTEIYETLREAIKQINIIVDALNTISGIKLLKEYYNGTDKFSEETTTKDGIDGIFKNPLAHFPQLPETLNKYIFIESLPLAIIDDDKEKLILNAIKVKKQIWENYLPMISNMNNIMYIGDKGLEHANTYLQIRTITYVGNNMVLDKENKPKLSITEFRDYSKPSSSGFIVRDCDFMGIFQDISKPPNTHKPDTLARDKSVPYLPINPDAKNSPNQITKLKLELTGKHNIEPKATLKRSNGMYPSIKSCIDLYLHNLKSYTINYIISKINENNFDTKENIIGKKSGGAGLLDLFNDVNSPYKKLNDSLTDYIKKIREKILDDNIEVDRNDILISVISVLVNKLMDTFIDKCIREASLNEIIKYVKKLDTAKPYENQLSYNYLNPKTYKNLEKIIDRIMVLKEPITYKFDANDIFKFLVEKYTQVYSKISPPLELYQIEYANKIMQNYSKTNVHKHHTYDFLNNLSGGICYDIDNNLTDLLLNKDIDINAKDRQGNTALMYAITSRNLNITQKLLNKNAQVNTELSRNTRDQTPLLFAIKTFTNHLEVVANMDTTFVEINAKIYDVIKQQPSFGNNIILYSDNMFKMCIIMLNYAFYTHMAQYRNGWTYDKQLKCIEDITKIYPVDSNTIYNFPLSDIYMNEDTKRIVFEEIKKINSISIAKLADKEKHKADKKLFNKLNEQYRNLKAELQSIEPKIHIDKHYEERYEEIKKLMKDIDENKVRSTDPLLSKDINVFHSTNVLKSTEKQLLNSKKSTIDNISFVKNTPNGYELETTQKNFNSNVNTSINSNKTPDEIFHEFFKKFINGDKSNVYNNRTDLSTYLVIWDIYVKQSKCNFTQIHLLISKFMHKLLSNNIVGNKITNIDKLSKICNNMKHLYGDILSKFVNDYDSLPEELNSNMSLKVCINIITHVVQHNICVMLYRIIVKILVDYIFKLSYETNIFDNSERVTYTFGLVDDIIQGKNKESKLMKYIIQVIPSKIVKLYLKIYDSEEDKINYENNNVDIDKIFDNIVNIIINSEVIPMNKKEILVEQLNTYVFEYFKTIFAEYIPKMKQVFDNYIEYIKVDINQIGIITCLLDKALTEQ